MSDKCPFCGAVWMPYFDDWECKTYREKSREYNRGEQCYESQIANLQASRDRWRELGFNEGVEAAAKLFDEIEIKSFNAGAEWDRTRIIEGSKYCVPTNGPAIACIAAESKAREIRALKITIAAIEAAGNGRGSDECLERT